MLRALVCLTLSLALLVTFAPARAQDDAPDCDAMLQDAIAATIERCAALDGAVACAAAGDVSLVGADGADHTAALPDLTALHVGSDGGPWSVARLNLPDRHVAGQAAALIVFGPATLTFEDAPNLAPGAAFTLETANGAGPCEGLPFPGVVVQAPEKNLALLRVNGIDLAVNGTAVIHAPSGEGTTISALTRETILGDTGVVVFAGYRVAVEDGAIGTPEPYDPERLANLPAAILPRMELVTAPGSATVREPTVLHLRPEASAYTGTRVPVGLPVNAFGTDASGAWLYVRTYDGLTGWVPREVLDEDFGSLPTLDAPPAPPTRPFGPAYARGATTSERNNLRAGPGTHTEIVDTLPTGTALTVYARNETGDWLLVEADGGTRAWISATLFRASTPFVLAELPVAPDETETPAP